MKKSLLLLLTLLTLSLNSCREEEADLIFSYTVSNPENAKVIYESPDPLHCPKAYEIRANYEPCEITLKCKNAKNLYINNDPTSPNAYHNPHLNWTAVVINSTTIKIFLYEMPPKLDPEKTDYRDYTSYLSIYSNTKKDPLSDCITIERYPTLY